MSKQSIAVIGGTGALGRGLTMRWLSAGYSVFVGTRNIDKAGAFVDELHADLARHGVSVENLTLQVLSNEEAASKADVIVLTVPYTHQKGTLEMIRDKIHNKIVIDTTVPLRPPKVAKVQLPEAGSAAQEAQAFLNQTVDANIKIVSAFQNVAAAHLQSMHTIDCDVLVCGEKTARESVLDLIESVGVRAFSAGPLANAAAAEALTSILITINKKHKCHSGIRISGV